MEERTEEKTGRRERKEREEGTERLEGDLFYSSLFRIMQACIYRSTLVATSQLSIKRAAQQ